MSFWKRSFRHWTPRYIWDRANLFLFEYRHPEAPWITEEMINILETWLSPQDCGFECGAGRSTIWLASRVQHLTTIEHSAEWADKVDVLLRTVGLSEKVTLRLLPDGDSGAAASQYLQTVRDISEESLDFFFVDGVSRDYCAIEATNKVKRGGIVIVDNINWYFPTPSKSRSPNSRNDGFASEAWAEFAERISGWRSIWTTNGVTDTALWIRPYG